MNPAHLDTRLMQAFKILCKIIMDNPALSADLDAAFKAGVLDGAITAKVAQTLGPKKAANKPKK